MRESIEVAIVGGGIVGAATAYFLSKASVESVIFDRDPRTLEASGKAYGGLYPLSGTGIPGPLYEFARFSFDLHQELAKEYREKWKYQNRPSMSLAFNAAEIQAIARHVAWVNEETPFRAELLDTDATLSIDGRINPSVAGAGYYHDALEVDPTLCTNGLRAESGCNVEQGAVREIRERVGNGLEIIFSDRSSVRAHFVIVALGPWTPSISACSHVSPYVTPLKGQLLRFSVRGKPIKQSIGYQGNYITTKWDGLTWAGTTEEETGFENDTNKEARKEILSKVSTMLPALKVEEIARQTACLRPMSRDGLPIVGRISAESRIFVGTGGGRKGILLAPAIGKALSDMILGSRPSADVGSFSPLRFT